MGFFDKLTGYDKEVLRQQGQTTRHKESMAKDKYLADTMYEMNLTNAKKDLALGLLNQHESTSLQRQAESLRLARYALEAGIEKNNPEMVKAALETISELDRNATALDISRTKELGSSSLGTSLKSLSPVSQTPRQLTGYFVPQPPSWLE